MFPSSLVPLSIFMLVDFIHNGTQVFTAPCTLTNSLGMWYHMEMLINTQNNCASGPGIVTLFTLMKILQTDFSFYFHALAWGTLQMYILCWFLAPTNQYQRDDHLVQFKQEQWTFIVPRHSLIMHNKLCLVHPCLFTNIFCRVYKKIEPHKDI